MGQKFIKQKMKKNIIFLVSCTLNRFYAHTLTEENFRKKTHFTRKAFGETKQFLCKFRYTHYGKASTHYKVVSPMRNANELVILYEMNSENEEK